MGLLIKRFNNNAQYETFTGTSEFIAPNVSLVLDGYDVHYKSEEPTPSNEDVSLDS